MRAGIQSVSVENKHWDPGREQLLANSREQEADAGHFYLTLICVSLHFIYKH